jgi:serine/threonine protein kinase
VEEEEEENAEDHKDSSDDLPFEFEVGEEFHGICATEQPNPNKKIIPQKKILSRKSREKNKNVFRDESCWSSATLFIQMHLYPETLSSWLKRPGRTVVNWQQSFDIFIQIVEALRFIHSQGIIHRDLKVCCSFFSNSCSIFFF